MPLASRVGSRQCSIQYGSVRRLQFTDRSQAIRDQFGACDGSPESPLHPKCSGASLETGGGVITVILRRAIKMKPTLLTVALLVLLVSATHEVQAQGYGPYGDWGGYQFQQYALQNDPYAQLHILHYQLYLPYQSYPVFPFQP